MQSTSDYTLCQPTIGRISSGSDAGSGSNQPYSEKSYRRAVWHWLDSLGLKGSAKIVAQAIGRLSSRHGHAFNRATVAKAAGLPVRTVARHLTKLTHDGYVSAVKIRRPDGRFYYSRYQLQPSIISASRVPLSAPEKAPSHTKGINTKNKGNIADILFTDKVNHLAPSSTSQSKRHIGSDTLNSIGSGNTDRIDSRKCKTYNRLNLNIQKPVFRPFQHHERFGIPEWLKRRRLAICDSPWPISRRDAINCIKERLIEMHGEEHRSAIYDQEIDPDKLDEFIREHEERISGDGKSPAVLLAELKEKVGHEKEVPTWKEFIELWNQHAPWERHDPDQPHNDKLFIDFQAACNSIEFLMCWREAVEAISKSCFLRGLVPDRLYGRMSLKRFLGAVQRPLWLTAIASGQYDDTNRREICELLQEDDLYRFCVKKILEARFEPQKLYGFIKARGLASLHPWHIHVATLVGALPRNTTHPDADDFYRRNPKLRPRYDLDINNYDFMRYVKFAERCIELTTDFIRNPSLIRDRIKAEDWENIHPAEITIAASVSLVPGEMLHPFPKKYHDKHPGKDFSLIDPRDYCGEKWLKIPEAHYMDPEYFKTRCREIANRIRREPQWITNAVTNWGKIKELHPVTYEIAKHLGVLPADFKHPNEQYYFYNNYYGKRVPEGLDFRDYID